MEVRSRRDFDLPLSCHGPSPLPGRIREARSAGWDRRPSGAFTFCRTKPTAPSRSLLIKNSRVASSYSETALCFSGLLEEAGGWAGASICKQRLAILRPRKKKLWQLFRSSDGHKGTAERARYRIDIRALGLEGVDAFACCTPYLDPFYSADSGGSRWKSSRFPSLKQRADGR